MITEVNGKCNYDDCQREATQIAAGRSDSAGIYCEKHAEIVSEEGKPEYVVDCPNCHCSFGVN